MMGTDKENVEKLRQWLNGRGAGKITEADAGRLKELLRLAWPEIDGGGETKMAPRKIDRAESMRWNPPNLSFETERHGPTVLGSVYAEVQLWCVDLESAVATVETIGKRQVHPKAPRFDVAPVARDVVAEVIGRKSKLIRWTKDGTKFQLERDELPR